MKRLVGYKKKLIALGIVSALLIVALGVPGVMSQVTPFVPDVVGRFIGPGGTGIAPVLSACGTSPTIVGSDTQGAITSSSSAPGAACTLTFFRAFSVAPTCYFNDQSTANKTNGTSVLYKVVESATAVTVTFATTPANSDIITYFCIGRTS